MRRRLFDEDHEAFRDTVRAFIAKEITPHAADWDAAGLVDRELYLAAGRAGLLATAAPEEYGGGGVTDFRFNVVITEELMATGHGSAGLGMILHNDVCLPYFLAYASIEQQQRWLPGIVSGELVTAIAMTEPGAGSDLAAMDTTAVRDGEHYVLNGAKTFITNGIHADLVIVAAKTDPTQRHHGMSLLVVERDTPGFTRGRNLDKLGQHAQDTAELAFADARVPVGHRLGPAEGHGFAQLMANLPQERLSIAVGAVAATATALHQTMDYVRDRTAFGRPVATFQHTRFTLAEIATELDIAQSYVDDCVRALDAGELTAVDAAKAKWWCTELQGRAIDRCLQLHGGYGYMTDYPIARAWADARVSRIYGGTTEIMKEVVGRDLGL